MMVRANLAAGILPVRRDGRVLLLLRPATGTWEPPAGRLHPGETFEQGAVREVYEETGLLVAPQMMLATWVGTRADGEPLASVTYAGRVGEEEPRITPEHSGARWFTVEEWLDVPSWWSREDILRVPEILRALPEESAPAPSPPRETVEGVVSARLGSGAVLVDLSGEEPRALLLRRRKPPVGLWENPGGALEPGEDFVACARRELHEETGIRAEPELPWWARVEPWRSPDDPELYAGVGFLARHPGGEITPEAGAHDACRWVTEEEWRSLRTWYTERESDALWWAVRHLLRERG